MLSTLLRQLADSDTRWSLAATVLKVGSAALVLPIVLRTVPPQELGLWYVFTALGSLSTLVDFGAGPTIARAAAYFWAGASEFKGQGLASVADGLGPNIAGTQDLVSASRAVYTILALVVLLGIGTLGGFWIAHSGSAPAPTRSGIACIIYIGGVSYSLFACYNTSILNGIGEVRRAQRAQCTAYIAYLLVAIPLLYLVQGVLALSVSAIVPGLVNRGICKYHLSKAGVLPARRGPLVTGLIRSLWPNAWRTGLVSLGAYMITTSSTLICSHALGLKTTARYGLTIQIAQLLATLSMAFVTAKLPLIAIMRCGGKTDGAVLLFMGRVRAALVTYLVGALLVALVAPLALDELHSKTQLLSMAPLLFVLACQCLEMHHSMYGGLILTENVVPFVKPALLSGLAVVVLGALLVRSLGLWGLLISAAGVQAAYNNWWTVLRGIRGTGVPTRIYLRRFFQLASCG